MLLQDLRRSAETQERNRRRQERTDNRMNLSDIIRTVQQAPNRAAYILSKWKAQTAAVESNDLIWPQGRLNEAARLRDESLAAARSLAETTDVAIDIAAKALTAERDKLRPKVDPATQERLARQMTYLLDRGIPLEEIISDNAGNPTNLRVLEDEVPVFSRGREPQYKEAGHTFDELLHQAAWETYGGQYKAADDRIKEFERGSYRARVAVNQAARALMQNDRGEQPLPAYEDGHLIEA